MMILIANIRVFFPALAMYLISRHAVWAVHPCDGEFFCMAWWSFTCKFWVCFARTSLLFNEEWVRGTRFIGQVLRNWFMQVWFRIDNPWDAFPSWLYGISVKDEYASPFINSYIIQMKHYNLQTSDSQTLFLQHKNYYKIIWKSQKEFIFRN